MTTIEFLNSVKPDNRFVSETAQSYFDQSLYLAEAIQVAYNETFQAIGLDELAMVMEAEGELSTFVADKETIAKDKKTILTRIADFFKTAWAAIKAFFNKLIATVKAYFGKYKKNYVKFLDEADKFFKDYDGEEISFGKVYADIGLNDIYEDGKDAFEKIEKVSSNLFNAIKANAQREDFKDIFDMEITKKSILKNADVKNKSSLRVGLKSFILDGVKLVEVSSSNLKNSSTISSIKANAFKESEWLNLIKKEYNDAKKFIDNLMKDAKNITNSNPENIKIFMNASRALLMLTMQTFGAVNDATKDVCGKINSVAKRIIVKFLQLSGKNVKEILGEATEEKDPENFEGELISDKDVSSDLLKEAVDSVFDWLEA